MSDQNQKELAARYYAQAYTMFMTGQIPVSQQMQFVPQQMPDAPKQENNTQNAPKVSFSACLFCLFNPSKCNHVAKDRFHVARNSASADDAFLDKVLAKRNGDVASFFVKKGTKHRGNADPSLYAIQCYHCHGGYCHFSGITVMDNGVAVRHLPEGTRLPPLNTYHKYAERQPTVEPVNNNDDEKKD